MTSADWAVGRAPRALELLAGGAFGALAAVRRRRGLHPRGCAYEARVRILDGVGDAGFELPPPLEPGAAHDASVRLSRGAGVPPPLPDFLGVAVKLHDADGKGADQDLLFTSSANRPVLHHALVPVRGFAGHTYSTSLPYRVGGRLAVFGVRSQESLAADSSGGGATGSRWQLLAARLLEPWQPIGEVELGEPLSEIAGERLRFNPWHTAAALRPAGMVNAVRDSAYRASQAARPLS